MEGLLKIKGVVFFPGAPFLPKPYFFVYHFGCKSGPRNYKKGIQKLYTKICEKGTQKYTKTTPK